MKALLALMMVSAVASADSSVEKPAPNRDVLGVCEKYRQAMEARDATALIALAHPKYHEDAGTPSPDDDYDYEGLKTVLTTRLRAVKGVRLKLTYRNVVIDGERARVEVQRDATLLLAVKGGSEKWIDSRETHDIRLQRDGKRWLIISGM